MGAPKSFLPTLVTNDDEARSLVSFCANSDSLSPVPEAARKSESPAALQTAPKHALDERRSRSHHAYMMRSLGTSQPDVSAQKVAARSEHDETRDASAYPQHDPWLLGNSLDRTLKCNVRNEKARRKRLKVRCCVLSPLPVYAICKRGRTATAEQITWHPMQGLHGALSYGLAIACNARIM
jgi:hypothetical protein